MRLKNDVVTINLARLAKLVDATDSKSVSERSPGSSPGMGTSC